MKLIMTLDWEDYDLKKNYDYIVLKKGKTIIKNLELLSDMDFISKQKTKGNIKFLVESWEKYDGDKAIIICGDKGGKLKPIHVSNVDENRKALFQTEENITISIDFIKGKIKIYKNAVNFNEIKAIKLHSIPLNDFNNNRNQETPFDKIIQEILDTIDESGFSYDNPLHALLGDS